VAGVGAGSGADSGAGSGAGVGGGSEGQRLRSSRRAGGSPRGDAEGSASRRTDWRLGGRTVQPWRSQVLAVALLGVGIAVLAGTALTLVLPPAWGGLAATAVLWIGMLLPVVWAFSRSRPAGLLRITWLDLLWGVGLGVLLRMVQGWLSVAAGGSGALPSYPSIGGSLPSGFVFTDVVAPVVIAPVIEEFFFHAVVLVSVYTLLRRPVGSLMAGACAVVVSAGLFVLVHTLTGALSVDAVISLSLLGLVCGALVMLTGRVWPAVLVHAVYNGSYVVLALAGTLLG
jgi:membrane protease YdiL (CAAX protease family)